MENSEMEFVGKFFFWGSFLLGSICLFGYMITSWEGFVEGGILLLTFGTVINLTAAVGLLLYGAFNKPYLDSCVRGVCCMLVNIPIAVLYAFIGINIIHY
ncbi:LIVCS family branched-chain amino acid:cation transporter [Chryseobacterium defluvii]|uniref:LIVCS family branched-chain amino acid:cation transporter n=2 Tax=Chryseobacterium defluvii TaxID=160396 RepID=A0A495S8S5_9FLAO|nr:LIVCS family branched-chain amino acid:cation transporter [Chryseobacterium defluvii]